MTNGVAPVTHFPGGTSVSRLRVYSWVASDGLAGGTPHLHTSCSEAYVVLGGQGRVQTLSVDGFTETPLLPSAVVWFSPGVIHRLVNDGDLQLLVIMQNSGLPEAGDAMMTFPPEYLADRDRYRAAATLPSKLGGPPDDEIEASARRRQRLAVDGFLALRRAVEEHGTAALTPTYDAARALVAPNLANWRKTWSLGASAAAEQTADFLSGLEAGDASHLADAKVQSRLTPDAHAFGMCGYLDVYGLNPSV